MAKKKGEYPHRQEFNIHGKSSGKRHWSKSVGHNNKSPNSKKDDK